MTLPAFALAILGLLLTPGPTNTLLALAGAREGTAAARRLLPAEAAGYLVAVLPLNVARLWFDPMAGPLGQLVQIAAALWVAALALRLARPPTAAQAATRPVTAAQVFLTTLLNPKVLLVALVLTAPPGAPGHMAELAVFFALVPVMGFCWTRLGALLDGARHPRRAGWLQRGAALWLAALALGLAHRALIG